MLLRPLGVLRLRGIEVRLDPSLLLLAVLIVWVFSTRFSGRFAVPVATTMAVAGALLVVTTTLAHELAHALEARHRGIHVEAVTLLLFGGVTEMHARGQSARDELGIAVIGPYVSLVCGASLGLVAFGAGELLPDGLGDPVAEVAGLLAWWNVLLALFNIVPGAPLDGGRVLRALMWMLLGDRLRGLRISVRMGQAIGLGLVVAGGWVLSRAPDAIRPTSVVLLAVLVAGTGLFLSAAAGRELRHAELDEALARWTAGSLLGQLHAGGSRPGHGQLDGSLPAVDVEVDLHTLIDAFQGGHGLVRVTRAGETIDALSEGEVARALRGLRRTVRRGRGRTRSPAATAGRDGDGAAT